MSNLLLNLDELSVCHEKSEHNRKKLFDDILKKCHNKITKYNKEFKKKDCLFLPPKFIIGSPPYNYIDLIDYLINSLKKNGLRVEWMSEKEAIYISWKVMDINMQQYQSHFSNTVYSDDFEQQMTLMSVRPKINKPQSTKRKKNDNKPVIQHVAMIDYGSNTKDLIPINAKFLGK